MIFFKFDNRSINSSILSYNNTRLVNANLLCCEEEAHADVTVLLIREPMHTRTEHQKIHKL